MRAVFSLLCAVSLLAAVQAPAGAQDAAAREVTVLLAGVSRGYVRPLWRTALRVQGLPGIEKATALGAQADVITLRVTTTLNNTELAGVLQGTLTGADGDRIAVATNLDQRSRRAEARWAITRIIERINAQPKPNWSGRDAEALFAKTETIEKKLAKLGLEPGLLEGMHYKAKDYHIDENWYGSGGSYRVWAGDKWQGVPIFDENYWWGGFEEEEAGDTFEVDPESKFVGAQLMRNYWYSGTQWADYEGAVLSSHLGERAKTTFDGGLIVHIGRSWYHDIFGAMVALSVREPKRTRDEMPKGRGWNIMAGLEERGFERWGEPGYNLQAFLLEWPENEDDHLVARLRAHHPGHALYLDAEIDVTEAVAAFKKEKGAEKDPQTVDVKDRIKWHHAAEDSTEVFSQRRQEAITRIAEIQAAITKLAATTPLNELCGVLSDEALAKRLAVTFSAQDLYAPGQFVIRQQLFGDVEIACGEPKNGGTRWLLFNPKSGEVIRSYQ